MPDEVFCFFHSLGIDMKKITEIYVNRANPDGTLLYGGFCHLCGTMPEGKSAWVETQENTDLKTFVWQKEKTQLSCGGMGNGHKIFRNSQK